MEKKPFMKDSAWVGWGIYGAVGFQLAACVVGGLYLGSKVDDYFQTKPWLALVGLTLGGITGFYNLFRILKYTTKGEEE